MDISTINQLAQKSDRWFAIALALLVGVMSVAIAKYFMRTVERLSDDQKREREAYQESLKTICGIQQEQAKNLAILIDRNSAALDRNTSALEDVLVQVRNYK